jgi:hypothetical protein
VEVIMIGIAQRDIVRIPTTYGQLQVDDRIELDGQMCTITVIAHVMDYTIVTARGDYYGVFAFGKPSREYVTRSARDCA